MSRVGRLPLIAVAAIALMAGGASVDRAQAQTKLEATYVATLAGLPLGKGVWLIDVTEDQYSAMASGKTTGLLQIFAGGQGSVAAHGAVNGGRPVPASYAANVVSDKKFNEVKMAISAGNVKEVSAEPPSPPQPDRVPVTDAHRQGVFDPMSAVMMAVPGNGDSLSPDVCNRTVPVFDGRGRFDLALSFKRMEQVKAEKGYQGRAVVCAVSFRPISGHRPSQSAIKYLVAAQDIEVWLAPLNGTRILVPFHIVVPTVLGPAVLHAKQFVIVTQSARQMPTTLKTQ